MGKWDSRKCALALFSAISAPGVVLAELEARFRFPDGIYVRPRYKNPDDVGHDDWLT